MATTTTTNHDHETIWNCCFGPTATPETVLLDAASQSVTAQDYARGCVSIAADQGFDGDQDEAFSSLCKQLGIAVS